VTARPITTFFKSALQFFILIQVSTDLLHFHARCISSSQQPEEITSTKEDCDRTHSKFSTFHPAICRATRDSFMNILMKSEFALITYLLVYILLYFIGSVLRLKKWQEVYSKLAKTMAAGDETSKCIENNVNNLIMKR
jgi:hypothetical protein